MELLTAMIFFPVRYAYINNNINLVQKKDKQPASFEIN